MSPTSKGNHRGREIEPRDLRDSSRASQPLHHRGVLHSRFSTSCWSSQERFMPPPYCTLLDNRLLLIPWLTVVSMTTVFDVGISLYFITDMQINAFVITMYITDYALCCINLPVLTGGNNKHEPPKLNSLSTWPSRTQPTPTTVSATQNMTQTSPQTGTTSSDKVVPLERKPVLQMMPAIPEVSNAFVCGQEDMSSSARISTAETSLQPYAEEADHRRNDAVLVRRLSQASCIALA
ncbi:hypothetical protein HPB51_019177 [Rhipicephalus microplus]|uniref:Uncharacterized protein n=1 Tax=Rhipicephalus microplus TaxID=6941 RepID=A0A9J6DW49_RHIMP|nr:hypothetical protein HPB51_019177 [Rhipicephalus microplus]